MLERYVGFATFRRPSFPAHSARLGALGSARDGQYTFLMGLGTFAGMRRPRFVRADRFENLRRIEAMDPVADHRAIYEITTMTLEFPWDITQALGLALFRTYAVPSIGRVLFRTGEFTERVQKRYDDTGLILDLIGEHGFTDGDGLTALRRMNRMHGAYGISNDDLRLRPLHLRRHADPLARRLRVATDVRARTDCERRLLPGAPGRHMGIRRHPGRAPRVRRGDGRL